MDTAQSPGPRPAVAAASWADAGTLLVLLVTVVGFVLPMLLVYPPVRPRPSELLSETHSKLGLGWGPDGDDDDAAAKATGTPRIRGLWVYPIKSCPGIRVARSAVGPTGLAFDRLFAFAQLASRFPARAGADVAAGGRPPDKDGHDDNDNDDDDVWEVITQRVFPRLATLQVELAPRAKLARGWRAVPEIEVVLPIEPDEGDDGDEDNSNTKKHAAAKPTHGKVRIWRDTVRARNLSAEVPRALQLYLGVSNRLGVFRVDPAHLRQIFRCAPRKDAAGYQPVTGFQDAYPVHLLNRNSVRALNAVVQTDAALPALDVRRFRANIVVDGVEAYDEDSWKLVSFKPAPGSPSSLDEAKFHVSCRTVRCKLPNVNPDTGERHPREPDFSLRKHREIDAGAPKMGCLGMQLTPLFDQPDKPESMELTLEAGMAVDVLARGEHLYVKI
ncbi:Molybdenum cofactor sulfurase [Niveomyces insectorum RCEF 264]|uniref:Molybdenum cofactor sulfurase n=1 Tax=Niveomyces insectorum RCEF 264 TaxID=1081102 RepID=A0A167QXF3_9HYPO|nr:Molybdenum cofactor sulfurase [Niveomyces insectorum RCEF 264]